MTSPIISLPWSHFNRMAYSLSEFYSELAADFFRAAIMKMMLESTAGNSVSIDTLMGRAYTPMKSNENINLSLPFTEDELDALASTGRDLSKMSAERIGALFIELYEDAGALLIDVGVDSVLPSFVETESLKAVRSNDWGAYLLTHVRDQESGGWMPCPPSPLV